jgi:hypothetical protein
VTIAIRDGDCVAVLDTYSGRREFVCAVAGLGADREYEAEAQGFQLEPPNLVESAWDQYDDLAEGGGR